MHRGITNNSSRRLEITSQWISGKANNATSYKCRFYRRTSAWQIMSENRQFLGHRFHLPFILQSLEQFPSGVGCYRRDLSRFRCMRNSLAGPSRLIHFRGVKSREARAKSEAISFSKDTYTSSSLKQPVAAARVCDVQKIWVRKRVLFVRGAK